MSNPRFSAVHEHERPDENEDLAVVDDRSKNVAHVHKRLYKVRGSR